MEETIRKIAQEVYTSSSTADQYQVAPVPFHVHDSNDSQRIDYFNLTNKVVIVPHTVFGASAATASNYNVFFTAPYPMTIYQITEVHTVKGTDAGAVSLDLEKLTGTIAPGSGVKVTQQPFNLKGTINTVLTAPLANMVTAVNMAAGDRLALLLTGTPTSLSNVSVTVLFKL